MTPKAYDEHYYRRWYHDPARRVIKPCGTQMRLRSMKCLAVAVDLRVPVEHAHEMAGARASLADDHEALALADCIGGLQSVKSQAPHPKLQRTPNVQVPT